MPISRKTKTISQVITAAKNIISPPTDRGWRFENVAKTALTLGLFLLPLTVTSWTTDSWELSKSILLLAVVSLAAIAFAVVLFRRGTAQWQWHPLDLLVLGLGVATAVGTLTSVHPWASLAGVPGWQSHTLPLTAAFLGYYFLMAATFRTVADRRIAWAAMLGGLGVSLLLQNFQFANLIPWPAIWADNALFSTLSNQPVQVAVLAAVFAAAWLLFVVRQSRWWWTIGIGGTVIAWVVLLYLGQPLGWAAFALGMVLVVLDQSRQARGPQTGFIIIIVALAGAGLVAQFANLSSHLIATPPKAAVLDQGTSADVAGKTIWQRPVLGSGPSTWYEDFVSYRPTSFNQQPSWSLRFYQAGNEWWQILATLGVVGTLFWVGIIGLGLTSMWRQWQDDHEPTQLIAALFLVMAVVSSFFTTWSLVMLAMVWAALGLSRAQMTNWPRTRLASIGAGTYIGTTVGALLLILFWIPAIGVYASDIMVGRAQGTVMNEGKKSPKTDALEAAIKQAPGKVVGQLRTALQLNPRNLTAGGFLTQAYLTQMGVDLQSSKSAEAAKDLAKINDLLALMKKRFPNDPQVYENEDNVLNILSGYIPDAITRARTNFQKLRELEPSNPIHDVGYGQTSMLVWSSDKSTNRDQLFATAVAAFRDAMSKKTDYIQARYALVVALRDGGQLDLALRELDQVQNPPNNTVGTLLTLRGTILSKMNKADEAITAFDQAIAFNPQDEQAYLAKAQHYLDAKANDKAKTVLNEGLKQIPNSQAITAKIAEIK